MKTYVVGTRQKGLTKALLMSTHCCHSIYFHGEIRKYFLETSCIWSCDVIKTLLMAKLIYMLMPKSYLLEPAHNKTNQMACVPSKDTDQPGHQPSLIRVFAVRMKALVLSYPSSPQQRL